MEALMIKYLIANLAILATLLISTIAVIEVSIAPPKWAYMVIVPVAFFSLGYLEERVFSGIVNRVIDRTISKNKTSQQAVAANRDNAD